MWPSPSRWAGTAGASCALCKASASLHPGPLAAEHCQRGGHVNIQALLQSGARNARAADGCAGGGGADILFSRLRSVRPFPNPLLPPSLPTAIGSPYVVRLREAFVTRECLEPEDDGGTDSSDTSRCSQETPGLGDAATVPFLVLNMVLERFGTPLSTCLKAGMAALRASLPAIHIDLCLQLTVQFLKALEGVHAVKIAHRVWGDARWRWLLPHLRLIFFCCTMSRTPAGPEAQQHPGGLRRL